MTSSIFRIITVFALCASLIAQTPTGASDSLMGFSSGSGAAQRSLENKFDSFLRAENLRDWNKRLSARPHYLGSPYGKENAEFIAAQFRSWGYDTQIEEFDVLFPSPKTRLVEMTRPERFSLKLNEPPVVDSTSGQIGA